MHADVDVCVVGGGPGGLAAAKRCAERGLSVQLLELGVAPNGAQSYLSARDAPSASDFRAGEGAVIQRGAANPWTVSALGGGMTRFAGIFLRMRESDFARTHDELPGADLDPSWPFGYEALREHYDAVEAAYGISRSSVGDRTQPPSIRPRLPPHGYGPIAHHVVNRARAHGISCMPTPLAVASRPYQGRPACRLGSCNERVCLSGARADPLADLWASPHAAANVIITTGAYVRRLVSDANGSVNAAEWVSAVGETQQVRARVFVLAANAVQSAALLLRSVSRRFPAGLGNEHDMVGRGLCLKSAGYISAQFPVGYEPAELSEFFSTMLTTDFYERIPGGGPGGLLYEAQPSARRRGEWRLHCVTADAPRTDNRVLLADRPAANDYPGGNVLLQYQQHEDDARRLRALMEVGETLIRVAGGAVTSTETVANHLGAAHLLGACRAGADPTTSVVDASGRVHGCPNVYVADGGFFPYPSAVNPTMTILANARRVASQIQVGCP